MTNENMNIWDQVSETDPNNTKRVGARGGFTSIDAHSQVLRATEVFGPVGTEWWYEAVYSETHTVDGWSLINCDLTFHRLNAAPYGPIRGCSVLKSPDKRPDTDAPKKSMTDALTKALSHLGFNADVFLGKFDDNKYVERLRRKGNEMPEGQARKLADLLDAANPETGEGVDAFGEAWVNDLDSDEQRGFGPWFSNFYPGAVSAKKQHMRDVLAVYRQHLNGESE